MRYAGQRFAKRYGGRLLPGIGAVLGAIDNGAAARETGERAITFYRPTSAGTPRPRSWRRKAHAA